MDQAPGFVRWPILQTFLRVLCDLWLMKPSACSAVCSGPVGLQA